MGIFLDEPKYPVIDKTPSFWKTVASFNFGDYQTLAAWTAVSIPFGYAIAGQARMRGPSMYAAGIIGATGGFLLAYQQSAGRLMGMFPNGVNEQGYPRRSD